MKNTALITGASSGIGLELAKIHASKGGNLVLVARNKLKLDELKTELENEMGVEFLNSLQLTEEQMEKLAHGNAVKLLSL